MIAILFIGIVVVLALIVVVVVYAAGGRRRTNEKPSPTVQSAAPSQGRSTGAGDN